MTLRRDISLPKALIFDMDGVIFDNNSFHLDSWMEYSKQMGHPLSMEDFPSKVYGKTNEEIIYALKGSEVSQEEVQLHAETKEALYRKMYDPYFKIAEGLIPLWNYSKEVGMKVGIGTNAPQSNLDYAVRKAGLDHYAQAFVHAHLVEKPKPAPDVYLKVMELLGVSGAESWIFEDSLTGVRAGKAAGATVIGITTTYPRADLEKDADWVVGSFVEVEGFLRQLMKGN
jgi:beta-phosphoglucomutase